MRKITPTPEPVTDRPAVRTLEDVPAQPLASDELLAAERALDALLDEGLHYDDRRAIAINAADVEALMRLEARHAVLPTLVDAAEAALHETRAEWIRTRWLALFDAPIQQHVAGIDGLIQERARIDSEIGQRQLVLAELQARREGVRNEMVATSRLRNEVLARGARHTARAESTERSFGGWSVFLRSRRQAAAS